VPPPSERQKIEKLWGKIHAPSEKYAFKLDGRNLTIRTDGVPTDGAAVRNHSMHARVARTVTGDFAATVRVLAADLPDWKSQYADSWPASRAGIFVAGGKEYAELDFLQYYSVERGVVKVPPFQVVWGSTQSKAGFHGAHVAKLDPLKSLYLRIVRKGKAVSDDYSFDGTVWTPTKCSRGVALPDEVTVGVYFAHTTHQVAEATFSDFTIEKLASK
jgi:hypothetical protein